MQYVVRLWGLTIIEGKHVECRIVIKEDASRMINHKIRINTDGTHYAIQKYYES